MNINKVIIACGSLNPELEIIASGLDDVQVIFLEQNLHRAPQNMKAEIQKELDRVTGDEHINEVILGYGLCSGGIVEVKAPVQGLFIPKVHDCIALMMGERNTYHSFFNKQPGTYHLTESWIENEKDPLGLLENEYTERVGREMAEYAIQEELKNYTHISFINTGMRNEEKYRKRARENAAYFKKEFIEIKGSGKYLRQLIHGPYDEPDFLYIKPGHIVQQKEFLT